jgi:rod shape-determining protein MreB
MDVRGRDIITGLPKTISVSSDDVTEAIQMELDGIANAVKECFAPDTAGTFY